MLFYMDNSYISSQNGVLYYFTWRILISVLKNVLYVIIHE